MLEKIANRRIINAPEQEKIVAKVSIFNELTQMQRFCYESLITRQN